MHYTRGLPLHFNRKTRLIDAIHGCQVARLHIANFRKEADWLLQELVLLSNYLDASTGGSDPDANIALRVSRSHSAMNKGIL